MLACALLHELGASADGVQCGELAAFCVHPSYRGAGRGDSLLDYVEQRARDKGIRRMVLSRIPCQHPDGSTKESICRISHSMYFLHVGIAGLIESDHLSPKGLDLADVNVMHVILHGYRCC